MKRHLCTFALILTMPMTALAADVTVCGSSNAGGGRNLEQAIALGGTVGIACPGSPVIDVVRTIPVQRPVVINGHFALTLHMNPAFSGPMFEVAGATSLTLGALKMQGVLRSFIGSPGNYASLARGAAATVNLRNVTVTGSTIPFRVAALVVTDSTFQANGIGSVVGALSIQNSRFLDSYSHFHVNGGKADIRQGSFVNNRGGGLSISGAGCALHIGGSRFERNGYPGTFSSVQTSCPTQMENVQFVDNIALVGAGLLVAPTGGEIAVRLQSVTFTHNVARQFGGAVAIRGPGKATIVIRNGDFQRNSAVFGGAIATDRIQGRHELQIARSVFQDNAATSGGGAIALRASALYVTQAAFAGNRADLGGALYLAELGDEPLRLANVVLRDNVARLGGAATFTGNLSLMNVTAVRNAGGAFTYDLDATDQATISAASSQAGRPVIRGLASVNSIIAYNTGTSCAAPITGRLNLQFPDASCGPAARIADPRLDDMLVPVPGSPAREAGDLQTCLTDPVSQRDFYGNPRPHSAGCTIGAVEGELDRFGSLLRRTFRRESVTLPWTVLDRPSEQEPDGKRLDVD